MRFSTLAALGLTSALLVAGGSAHAQKSQDTMRLAINDMFPTLDPYVFPQDEAGVFHHPVYQSLIGYEEYQHKFVPLIAKSWSSPEPGTYDFEIRDDVTFHSGNKLTADDVVYTLNFFADPKTKIRFKVRYDWMYPVEKIGPNTVRVRAKSPQAADLTTIAYRFRVFDKAIHEKLANYEDYGRVSGSGTGAYKLVSLERDKIVLERFADSKDAYQRNPVKRYIGISMPDEQSRIAQLLTGGVDALRNITPDNATSLAENPALTISDPPSGDLLYITLDAAGRSKNKVMMDQRVRKAVMMAIDREGIIQHIMPGHGTATRLSAICFDFNLDCSSSTKAAAYDPTAAKKLLAEAGLANGFDLELDVHEPEREIGEAVAGDLRKVGIRASVQPMGVSVYTKKRGDGEFTMFLGSYPTAAQPDMSNIYDFFFGADRDYYQDAEIHKAGDAAVTEFNDAKRQALYRQVVDRTNEMNYVLPFSSLPTAYAMAKDVKVAPDGLSATGVYANDLVWSDYKGK